MRFHGKKLLKTPNLLYRVSQEMTHIEKNSSTDQFLKKMKIFNFQWPSAEIICSPSAFLILIYGVVDA